MRRFYAALALLWTSCAFATGFDFRTTGTLTATYYDFRIPGSLPSVSASNHAVLLIDPACSCLKISINGAAYTGVNGGPGGSGVTSVFGRTGAVVANYADYLASQVQAVPFSTITGTDVQTQLQQVNARISAAAVTSVFGRTGAVTATAGDYTATKVTNTPAGNVASTDVQSAINELDTEKVDKTVANTYTAQQTYQTTGLSVLVKPPSPPVGGTKQFEVRSSTDTSLASIDSSGNFLSAGTGGFASTLLVNTTGTAAAPLHVFTSGTSTTAFGNVTATLRSGLAGRATTLQFSDTANTAQLGLLGAAFLVGSGGTERARFDGSTGVTTFTLPFGETVTLGSTGFANQLVMSGGNPASGGFNAVIKNTNALEASSLTVNDDLNHYFEIYLYGSSFASTTYGLTNGSTVFADASGRDLLVGTSSANKLVFGTNLTERMRIDSAGNVGIGVSPTNKFDVLGTVASIHNNGAAQRLDIGATGDTGSSSQVRLYAASTQNNWQIGNSIQTANTFSITPSTATNGTTFSTPAVTIDATGNLTFGGKQFGTKWDTASIGAIPHVNCTMEGGFCDIKGNAAGHFRFLNAAYTVNRFDLDTEIGSITSQLSVNDGSGFFVVKRLDGAQAFATDGNGNTITRAAYYERQRSAPMGEWTPFTPTVTPSVGTWTVPTYPTAKYMLVGKTLFVQIAMTGTTSNNARLDVTIPAGFTSANTMDFMIRNNFSATAGLAEVSAGATVISLFQDATGTLWTAGAPAMRAAIAFEIQ